MKPNKKKQMEPQNDSKEDKIQDEIRRRILKESRKRDGKEGFEETTRATLDALEDMVSLSREEMEDIAEQVKAEYNQEQAPEPIKRGGGWLFPWTGLGLVALTFYLIRRGSSWYLFTGLILIFALLNYFWKRSSDKDDDKL